MKMMSRYVLSFSIIVLLEILVSCRLLASPTKVRVVTWNVADNSKMQGSFTDEAIDKVLGLDKIDNEMPSIYAIGLQENCWMCNKQNLKVIGKRFISRIHRKAHRKYAVIGTHGTRMSSMCETGCLANTHGATVLLVIGKISLGASCFAFRHYHGCSSKFPRNKEKGVAAMKIMLKGKKTVCFATAHLDSGRPSYRRTCLQNFLTYADKVATWSQSCDAQFVFGDFNTRTGDDTGGPSVGKYVPKTTKFNLLKLRDELSGSKPYGADSEWTSNLLSYVNRERPQTLLEGPFNFMPTYSIKPARKFCAGKFPCYRTNRPMSWTDRIIYTRGNILKYDAIYEEYGDHFPVFAEFILPF